MSSFPKKKICQLIDNTGPGGAEKVAVLYYKMLSEEFNSYLCITRKEGILTKNIEDRSNILLLGRTQWNTLKSIVKFSMWLKKKDIQIIQAHQGTVYLAAIVSLFPPFPKIIWHGHFSPVNSVTLRYLKFINKRISFFLCVNEPLRQWIIRNLKKSPEIVRYVPNFSVLEEYPVSTFEIKLIGSKEKRIVCMANILNEVKNHFNLIHAFELLHKDELYKDYVLVLAGLFYENDSYYQSVRELIKTKKLEQFVQFTGSVSNVKKLLSEVSIAVISSKSEGFPMAILEYGLSGLPVVSTDVGQIGDILDHGKAGVLVESENSEALFTGLKFIIDHPEQGRTLAKNLTERIDKLYSQKYVYDSVKEVYISLAAKI